MIAKVLQPDALVGRVVHVKPTHVMLRRPFYGKVIARVQTLPGAAEQYVVAPDESDADDYYALVAEIVAVD